MLIFLLIFSQTEYDTIRSPENELERITVDEDTLGNSLSWGQIDESSNLACPKQFPKPTKISVNFQRLYSVSGFLIVSNSSERLNVTIEYSFDSTNWNGYTDGFDYNLNNVSIFLPVSFTC